MHGDEPIDRDAGLFTKIPAWDPQPETVQFGRILDPVRAAALDAAVRLAANRPTMSSLELMAITADFEKYLAGDDADG